MQFFEQLSSYLGEGYSLLITVTKIDGTLTVGILPKSEKQDSLAQGIKPLLFTGLPAQIDTGFFEAVSSPLEKTKAVMHNVISYEASLAKTSAEAEKAKSKTAAAPNKTATIAKAEVKPAPKLSLFDTPSSEVVVTKENAEQV